MWRVVSYRISKRIGHATPAVKWKLFPVFKCCYMVGIIFSIDLYWPGLSIVVGHGFVHWNFGLQDGFWNLIGANWIIGSAYVCLYLCLAEMIGVMPFSGGSFGFTRVTLNPYLGLLSSFGEGADYTCQVCYSLWRLSGLITYMVDGDSDYEPIYWVAVLIGITLLNTWQKSFFGKLYFMFPIICMALIAIYVFGNAAEMSFERNVAQQVLDDSRSDGWQFFRCFPNAAVFYVGLEAIALWCKDIEKPSVNVPRALIVCGVLVLGFSTIFIVAVSSTAPGVVALSHASLPLTAGFASAFDLSQRMGSAFNFLGLLCLILAFNYASVKQCAALFRSHLMMSPFGKLSSATLNDKDKQIGAAVSMFRVVLSIMLFVWFTGRQNMVFFFNFGILASILGAECIFLNFIIFRMKYGELKRTFTNPFGVYGAVYGMIVLFMVFVFTAACQQDGGFAILALTVWMGVVTVCYFTMFRSRQVYSAEEVAILFLIHVMKVNERKRQLMRHATKALKKKAVARRKTSLTTGRRAAPSAVYPTETELSTTGEDAQLAEDSTSMLYPSADDGLAASSSISAAAAGESDIMRPERRHPSLDTRSCTDSSGKTTGAAAILERWRDNAVEYFDAAGVVPQEELVAQVRDSYPHIRLPPIRRLSSRPDVAWWQPSNRLGGGGDAAEQQTTTAAAEEQRSISSGSEESNRIYDVTHFDGLIERVFAIDGRDDVLLPRGGAGAGAGGGRAHRYQVQEEEQQLQQHERLADVEEGGIT